MYGPNLTVGAAMSASKKQPPVDFKMTFEDNTFIATPITEAAIRFTEKTLPMKDGKKRSDFRTFGTGHLLRNLLKANGFTVEG